MDTTIVCITQFMYLHDGIGARTNSILNWGTMLDSMIEMQVQSGGIPTPPALLRYCDLHYNLFEH